MNFPSQTTLYVDLLKSELKYLHVINGNLIYTFNREVIPCSLRESLTLTNPQWVCYEIVTDTPQQEIEYYSTEVSNVA